MGGDRVPRRPRHRRNGGLMEDVIHALHRSPACLKPGGIPADEADVIADVAKVLASARGKVVEDRDLRAVAHQALHDV